MDERYIAAAVPVFLLLIGLELLLTRRSSDPTYAFGDSITNLSCGIGSQVLGVFMTALVLGGYVLVYEHLRITTLSVRSVAAWVVLLFALDLCYYAFHRASHRVNFLWAMHVVHHQSEEYNLSVALRQSWFDPLLQWVFYLPLAVLGFPPVMYLTMTTFNTLYQFWIHTRAIQRMGPLEWVLNTPSHHRVHHGVNPKYIDKNYAGVFIVWDRLFGTFRAEEEEPVYGTVKPLASFNPLWANLEHWATMARLSSKSSSTFEKLTVWIRPPEWLPRALGGLATIPETSREGFRRYAKALSPSTRRYIFTNYAVVLVAATLFLLVSHDLPAVALAAYPALVILALVSMGSLLESKRWARPLEAIRLPAQLALFLMIAHDTRWFVPAAIVAVLLSVLLSGWLLNLRDTPKSVEAKDEPLASTAQ